jgi:Na+/H+-dicarboxylate symporter
MDVKIGRKPNRLSLFIFVAMLLGIGLGWLIHETSSRAASAKFAADIKFLTVIFLNLVKVIIAPLVFSTLVVGIYKLGDGKAIGRIGGKTVAWFLAASLLSLALGAILVNIFQPGMHMHLTALPDQNSNLPLPPSDISFQSFVTHAFPSSIVDAMATNMILQIVVFSIFFGMAAAAVGEPAQPIIRGLDALAKVMLTMTGYIMNFAPLAAFGSMAATLAILGPEVLMTFGKFILEFYIALLVLWIFLVAGGGLFLKRRVIQLIRFIVNPTLLALTTASSEAAFPQLITQLEDFGCEEKIVSFVLPLGYSFNLDGSMIYMTFGSLFIAQAYGVHLSFPQQLTMLLFLMLSSKGMAGVPRAALVVITAIVPVFHIPVEGVGLILGIDQLLDMGRSGTNVIGNSIATAVVCKWENALKAPFSNK